jgi:hypothetical protein
MWPIVESGAMNQPDLVFFTKASSLEPNVKTCGIFRLGSEDDEV